jgi:hypothetical protein
VLDLGRRPEATPRPRYLFTKDYIWQDIDYTTKRISKFSNENRAGIEEHFIELVVFEIVNF